MRVIRIAGGLNDMVDTMLKRMAGSGSIGYGYCAETKQNGGSRNLLWIGLLAWSPDYAISLGEHARRSRLLARSARTRLRRRGAVQDRLEHRS